jgi:hypothetical protein
VTQKAVDKQGMETLYLAMYIWYNLETANSNKGIKSKYFGKICSSIFLQTLSITNNVMISLTIFNVIEFYLVAKTTHKPLKS